MTRRRWAIAAAAAAALALASQPLLPLLAERRLRSDLERVGEVDAVDVRAFPALQLLNGRADRVRVRMSRSEAGQRRLADLLDGARRTERLDARVRELNAGPLRLRDAALRKDGDLLVGEAGVTETDLAAALPPGLDLRPVASGGGELLFEGTASAFGRSVTLRARVAAIDGNLIVQPDVPLGGLAALTVFSDERLAVEGVAARTRPGGGFVLAARARLRD